MSHYHLAIFTGFQALTLAAYAEVTLDGTLGKSGALPGPDYQIGAELGQQHGGNLFHSFQDFNLQSHESATFSGPANVQNIISRVTGGNPSRIDGMLRSTIPNADLYFLNPYGILFGSNAKLDVQGGFHASTADYLRLQDGGRFEARTPENSLLTVAPVAAFGFLTDTPTAIKTQDSQLAVAKGKTFSLIGGGLEFNGSTPPAYDTDSEILTSHGSSWLLAGSGRLNLASVAARGEVIPTVAGLDLSAATTGGHIIITNTELGVSDEEGGGNIFIRGGRFEMTRSLINGQTVNQAGGLTDIQVANLTLQDQTVIETNTFGTGPGGHLNFRVTGVLNLTDSGIWSNSHGTLPEAGNAGNVKIQAHQINLAGGAQINSVTFGSGQGGTVDLQVAETLTAIGTDAEGYVSSVNADSANKEMAKAGDAGDVIIQARQVNLIDGAQIGSATFGTGQGGTIHLQVAETFTVTGGDAMGHVSGVFANSLNRQLPKAGNAGNLQIEARQLVLTGGGILTSGTRGTGHGGNLSLQVADTLTIAGQAVNGKKSSVVANSRGTIENAGSAGQLNIQANTINILKDGEISTQSENAGGGDLTIVSPNLLYLQHGQITTSVMGGIGDGGNITIDHPQFVVLNRAQIKAQADAGRGGNIRLIAQQFIPSADSLVSASSRLGIDGEVVISAPNENVGNKLLLSSFKPQNAASHLKQPCHWATLEAYQNRSRFYVYPLNGSPQTPEDWHPSPLLSLSQFSQTRSVSATGEAQRGVKPAATQVAAGVGECRKLD